MSKSGKQSAWQPGMEFVDETHYLKVVAEYSKELLSTCSPEEIADVAASSIMFIEVLEKRIKGSERLIEVMRESQQLQNDISKHRDEHIKDLQDAYAQADEDLNNSVPFGTAIRLQHKAIAEYRKGRWGQGGKARAQKYYDKAGAIADWKAEGHKYSSPRGFALNNYKKYGVTDFNTVYRWILADNKARR